MEVSENLSDGSVPSWRVIVRNDTVVDVSVSEKMSDRVKMSHYLVKQDTDEIEFSVSIDLHDDIAELRRFVSAMRRYVPYTCYEDLDNTFLLDTQATAMSCRDLAALHTACELVFFASGAKGLACGPYAKRFEKYVSMLVLSVSDSPLLCIQEDDSPLITCATEYPPLSVNYEKGMIMGIEGGYVAKHAELGGHNPFETSSTPVSQRAVATVMKMTSMNASEIHFTKNGYQCYLDTAPLGAAIDLTNAKILGEALDQYVCRQRFVTWACMQEMAQRNSHLNDYWMSVRNDGLRRKMVTYVKYSKGMDVINGAIARYMPQSRNGAMRRNKEIAILNHLMEESYKVCPRTNFGKGFGDDDLLFHFNSWNKKDLEQINPGDLVWPHADFSLLPRATASGEDFDAAIGALQASVSEWRNCRAKFMVPDFFGKFASIEAMLYGKSFTVMNKWWFLNNISPGTYDLYGVGSENYFLAVLPKGSRVEGLRTCKSNIVVTFFDVDEGMLKRFQYAKQGDVRDPRDVDYLVSDAEIDYEAVDVGRMFIRAHKGVAFKVIIRNKGFAATIRNFIHWANHKKWNYWVQKAGDQYNGEFILLAGNWGVNKKMANPSLNAVRDAIVSSVHAGEANRRRCLMLFILGAPFEMPNGSDVGHYLRAMQQHRTNRNYYVATVRSTSSYLRNY